MKKLICILCSVSMLTFSVFADKSAFYENGKVIDTMFVNAELGLRIRDYPSLKSNKICLLAHRMAVKIVAIGKEETIDGMTAPWVEIVLPRYKWKSLDPEYGWVFGGYLSQTQPAFIKPETAQELERYLSSVGAWNEYANDETKRYALCFQENHGFYRGILDTDIGESGSWKAISKDTVQFKTMYVIHEDIDDHVWSLTFTFFEDGNFYYTSGRDKVYCYPCVDYPYFPAIYTIGKYGNALEECEAKDYIGDADWYIKYGISAKGTQFEEQYRKYWDPIMRQRQRKADTMK
ncbi:MAG: SH3 domain-containing protein [Spirochaetaceae bacterium]|nr:SH3 domain-containing protein [Spirochaetaceae bacterium]